MNTLPAVSAVSRYTDKELISFLLNHARRAGQPVAIWRLPGAEATHLVLSDTTKVLERDQFIEELEPGFVVAPFEKTKDRFFLRADRTFTFQEGRLRTSGSTESERDAQWLATNLADQPKPEIYKAPCATPVAPSPLSRQSFLELVSLAVREVEHGRFEKIVPSRTRTIQLPDNFNLVTSFGQLAHRYPRALVSFLSIPGVGNWLGASPEVLVCVQDKSIFKTVALAGTLPYKPGIDVRSVAWTQKEIEEQALVERYVISCFNRIGLREYEEHGPRTVVAGNLMHLKSEFTVDIKRTDFPHIGTVMLDLLHPTSAVCGMPLETSLDFLHKHEGYDRQFYAGYLGPVNIGDRIDLFVNLRCMQLSGNSGVLYAGAGVTIDSIPEQEWQETEMKFDTLLNVIL